MGRHAVASTSRATGKKSSSSRRQQPSRAPTLGTNLTFKNDYQRDLDKINDVNKMQQFLLDEKTEDDVLLFCIARAPDKVPLMVKALLEIGDLKRCKDLLFFQDNVRCYTSFMLAMHGDDPVATGVLTLVDHVFEDDIQGLKTLLMDQSQGGLTSWMFLADAQISERDFMVRLESMLGFCQRLGHKDLIKHLSQTTLEDENILMMMCQKRPASLEALLDLLSEGFRPKELIKPLLHKNAEDENLFTHALQAPNSIRLKNLRVILTLAYRLPHRKQIEFIRGCLQLPGYEVLKNADVLMAATYLLSNKLGDFLNAVADETFAKKLMYFSGKHTPNGSRGPNALQLAIMQNKPEKVRLLLQCLERTLASAPDPQHRLQQVLRHWPSYSSAEKGGDALWFAIMHCPTVVPEILDFMYRHDREGLRRSLNGHTYILHSNGDGQKEVVNPHRIMTHASAILPPEIFQDFLNRISEQGFLSECLTNNACRPKGSSVRYPGTLNQVRHCFEFGTPENRSALLEKISEMEPTQQQAILNKQVLSSLGSHKSLMFLREILERFAPCIKQAHPEALEQLLLTGFQRSFQHCQAIQMRDYFLSMLKAHSNEKGIFRAIQGVINVDNIDYIGQKRLQHSLPLVREFFPDEKKIELFTTGLRLLVKRKNIESTSIILESISIIVNEMRYMPPNEVKAILSKKDDRRSYLKEGRCLDLIKALKLEKNSSDQDKATLEEIKKAIKDLYSGKYLQSSAGASSSTAEMSRRRMPAEDARGASSSTELSGNLEKMTLTPLRKKASSSQSQGYSRLASSASNSSLDSSASVSEVVTIMPGRGADRAVSGARDAFGIFHRVLNNSSAKKTREEMEPFLKDSCSNTRKGM